jgi:hypothetical protein
MDMPRTTLAFLIAPLVASLMYWWIELVAYSFRVGESLYGPLSFLAVIATFAYLWTLIAALPAYLVLRKFGWAKSVPILTIGTVLGWLFIAYCNDRRPLMHPEGFAVGLIAASTFLLVRDESTGSQFRSN